MFKLFVFTALIAVVTAKPGYLASPFVSTLVGEKTIESHGNAVVHATAPVVHAAPLIKTIAAEPIYNTVVAEPLIKTVAATPYIKTVDLAYAAPQVVYNAPAAYLAEKTISSHGHNIVHAAQPVISTAYATAW